MRISVCIPTYNRPDLLEQTLRSCLEQTLKPSEILIGDDSNNTRSEELAKKLSSEETPEIRYIKNDPALGQAANVNKLFSQANEELLLLIHDDDFLEATALEKLVSCFEKHPEIVAAFGKQSIVNAAGIRDKKASEELNLTFHRSSQNAGLIARPIESALRSQFPNNGFLIKTIFAKKVGYNAPNTGDACDFAFGVGLAQCNKPFYFLNEYTANYRLSESSIIRGRVSDSPYSSVKILEALTLEKEDWETQLLCTRAKIRQAIANAAELGCSKDAIRWYFSRAHLPYILSLGGAKRLVQILLSIPRPNSKERT